MSSNALMRGTCPLQGIWVQLRDLYELEFKSHASVTYPTAQASLLCHKNKVRSKYMGIVIICYSFLDNCCNNVINLWHDWISLFRFKLTYNQTFIKNTFFLKKNRENNISPIINQNYKHAIYCQLFEDNWSGIYYQRHNVLFLCNSDSKFFFLQN